MCDYEELKKFARIAKKKIDDGALEDVLRHLLSSRLLSIFPDSPWWVQAHVLGTESHVHFAGSHGRARAGFADSIVGKTAIEYEKDLNSKSVFDEGYRQVEEYCAALCNQGVPASDVFGVLSDTVHWYGYSLKVTPRRDGKLLGAENIVLIKEDEVDLSQGEDSECVKFEKFVGKYFSRENSRFLNPDTLADDFGVNSDTYQNLFPEFKRIVVKASHERPEYFKLIKKVWQDFVAYLGASDYGVFSIDTFVNEFYLVTVAKLLCANILRGESLVSEDIQLAGILNGEYFRNANLENLVDYDYFGWLNDSPYVELVVPFAKSVQKDMVAYDFKLVNAEDLFGQLLAQLANKEHRLLLGQEFTPHWVAHAVVEKVLAALNAGEDPKMIDMCCGSGVFLIEGIGAIRQKYNISSANFTPKKDHIIFSCILGFDIDPLAVMLAKVNWVLAMRDLFEVHTGSIVIPIYHADSLFMATPVSHKLPTGDGEEYVLRFGHTEVRLPSFLLTAGNRKLYDVAIAKVYKLAMLRAGRVSTALKGATIEHLVASSILDANVILSEKEQSLLQVAFKDLIITLEQLQRSGRNGIWSFVLSNSYRPGLIAQQFNCVVSNPPWLAMSKFAENPYRNVLTEKAELYGIKPVGPSHLHLELATTFLLTAIDKYLKDSAPWGCVMPSSVLNGDNHEPLRKERYRNARSAVTARVTDLWELPTTTFKNKAVVMFGEKSRKTNPSILKGRLYSSEDDYSSCEWKLVSMDRRSAWVHNISSAVESVDDVKFCQGADVFPRTALFHDFVKQHNGRWKFQRIEKSGPLYYLIDDSKKQCCADLTAKDFDGKFIYQCLISKHLSPFYVANPATVIIPAIKGDTGWRAIEDEDLALLNASTACCLNKIVVSSDCGNSPKKLFDKINIYGKLNKQDFAIARWLVLSNASGSNPCAGYVDLNKIDAKHLIIDQTLYWRIAASENEAMYLCGMLNSRALATAIMNFQPEGEFGRRHIHTLPYKITPDYDTANMTHACVVSRTKALIRQWLEFCDLSDIGALFHPNSGKLNSRRPRQQHVIRALPAYNAYEQSCARVLNTSKIEYSETAYDYAEAAHIGKDEYDPQG